MAFDVGAIVGSLQLKKDQWDKSIAKVAQDQKSLSGLVLRNSQQFKQMGMAMTVAGGAIVGAVGLMVKAYAGFDQSMTESLAIMGDVSQELREEMADAALEMSTQTVYSAKELAAAYFFLASAGMDAAQSIEALPPVAKFAQAGAFDLAVATDLLTDAQTALGLSSKDAIENQQNLIRVSDVLVGANTLANASVKQFAESLTNKAAAALVNVNKEMEEGVAVLAAYADKGIKGQLAGQRLTMMMNGLFDATRRNKRAWDEAGISLFNADESMRDIADIVQSLEGYLGAMTVKQREAALAALGFNLRTKDSILTLMGSSEKIRKWTEDLKHMQGITEEVAAKQLETLNKQLTLLKNTITKAAISIGKTLTPEIEALVKDLKDIIAGVSEWIKKHPELTGLIAKSTLAIGGLLAVLGPFMMMLPGIVIGLTAVGVSLTTVAVGFGTLALVIGVAYAAYEGAIWIRDKWEGKVSAEQQALYDTMQRWQNLSEAIGGFTTFLELAGEREIISAEKRREIWNKYGDDFIAGLKAISEGKEGPALKKLLKEIGDEHYYGAKAGGEQEKALDNAAEAAARLEKEIKDKLNKALKETTKDTIGVVYASDKLFLSLEDIGAVIKDIPPDMSKFGQTGKDVFDSLVPGFDSVKTSITSVDNEFGLLPSSFFDSGQKILTTSEKLAAGLLETGEVIGINWENVNEQIEAKWISTISSLITNFTSFKDTAKNLFDAVFKMFADTTAKMVVEWIKGNASFKDVLGGFKETLKQFAVFFAAWVSVNLVQHLLTAFGIIEENFELLVSSIEADLNTITKTSLQAGQAVKKIGDGAKEAYDGVDYLVLFGEAVEKVANLLEHLSGQGEISTSAQVALNDAWREAIELVEEYGLEGNKTFVDLIKQMRELGLESKALTEYTIGQLERIPQALTSVFESTRAKGVIEDYASVTVHSFNAMLASGMSWMEVVREMGEPLAILKDRYRELGLTADDALTRLFEISTVTEQHKALFTQIEANREIMEALGNSGWLTADVMNSLTTQATQYYTRLKDAGLSADDALRAMLPTLRQIAGAQAAYGFEIDENTQKLIDEATALGLLQTEQDKTVMALEGVFTAFADRMSEVFDSFGIKLEEIFSGININMPTTPEVPAFQHGGVIEAGPRQPTLIEFGEGSQRERAVISHVGGGVMGEGGLTIDADFNIENLVVRGDEDIERIEDAFRRNVEGLSEKVAGHLERFR